MGGSRARLIRQMLIESGLLALGGALVGLLLASVGIEVMLAMQPGNLPRVDEVRINALVLGFTLLAAAAAALAFGLVPAVQASRFELADSLKERGQTGSSANRTLIRNAGIVGEVALSVVLLIGAGLMVRSFVALNDVSPGYVADGVLTFNATPPFARYPNAVDRVNFQQEFQRRLESLPGVERASTGFSIPLTGTLFNGRSVWALSTTSPRCMWRIASRGSVVSRT